TGEVSVTPDVTQEHSYLEHLPDVLSEIVVPVRGPGGEVIGALDIQAMKRNAFPKQLVEQLRELAQAVSPTLYLAYLAREREQEQHVLTQLAYVAGAATKKLSSQHIYDEIVQTARKLLPDAKMYSLLRVKKDSATSQQYLARECAWPPLDTRLGKPSAPQQYSMSPGLMGRAVQTQQIQYMPDMPDVRALASQSSSRAAAQTRSELAIPLTLG